MSNINLKNFVDINIQQHSQQVTSGTRDTTVLYTAEGIGSTTHDVESMADATKFYSDKPNTLAYLKIYFNNGGSKVKVIEGVSIEALNDETINELPNDLICIAYAVSNEDKEKAYAQLKKLALNRSKNSKIYGINEKIILACTGVNSDSESVENFVVKYTKSQPGVEMTTAAYLNGIDVNGFDTIHDYAFTQESVQAENISNSDYEQLINNNLNVDINLARSVRNCGGNCKDGSSITNTFVRIILHQTLTDSVLNLLTQNIKNESGISKLYAVITQELSKYLTNGYLTSDSVWTDKDLIISYNNNKYKIISQHTAISNGYVVKILPISSLTAADKAAHKAPPIYIVLATQYGIRYITINGEII